MRPIEVGIDAMYFYDKLHVIVPLKHLNERCNRSPDLFVLGEYARHAVPASSDAFAVACGISKRYEKSSFSEENIQVHSYK